MVVVKIEALTFIFGILGASFIFSYLAMKLDDNHVFLKLLLLGLALASMFLLPKIMYDFQPTCENVLVSVNSSNVSFSQGKILNYGDQYYVYEYQCAVKSNTPLIFQKIISYGYLVFVLYFIIYIVYFYFKKWWAKNQN